MASRGENIELYLASKGERISSYYGWREHPVYKRRVFHTGIDIAVPYGTPVYAAAAGVIEYSGWSEGYGNLVIIRHRDNGQTIMAII